MKYLILILFLAGTCHAHNAKGMLNFGDEVKIIGRLTKHNVFYRSLIGVVVEGWSSSDCTTGFKYEVSFKTKQGHFTSDYFCLGNLVSIDSKTDRK